MWKKCSKWKYFINKNVSKSNSTAFDCGYWWNSVSLKNNLLLLETFFSKIAKQFNGEHFLLKVIEHNLLKYFLMQIWIY